MSSRHCSSFPAKTAKRFATIFVGCVGLLLAAAALFIAWRVATHNEGVVEPGRLYRSAQLDAPALREMIVSHGIRTVINLRGENARVGWYEDEVAVCRDLHVNHVDVCWSAKRLPPPAEVEKLLLAYRETPGPFLLHCRSGSDRTGLAAAIFLIDQDHVPWQAACRTLDWRYGHFATYPYFEMDEFVQRFGQSSGKTLADWVAQDYPTVYARESREPAWHEVMEPVELAVRGRL
jgi:protein tyrosine phosphatase (PTP) superfamily phosphohydrolase (DUF442 family)